MALSPQEAGYVSLRRLNAGRSKTKSSAKLALDVLEIIILHDS
jgi:hypothetical protein